MPIIGTTVVSSASAVVPPVGYMNFTYDAPVLTSVTPNGPLDGGAFVTLTGTNFGTQVDITTIVLLLCYRNNYYVTVRTIMLLR